MTRVWRGNSERFASKMNSGWIRRHLPGRSTTDSEVRAGRSRSRSSSRGRPESTGSFPPQLRRSSGQEELGEDSIRQEMVRTKTSCRNVSSRPEQKRWRLRGRRTVVDLSESTR